jgi:hypothetical protein
MIPKTALAADQAARTLLRRFPDLGVWIPARLAKRTLTGDPLPRWAVLVRSSIDGNPAKKRRRKPGVIDRRVSKTWQATVATGGRFRRLSAGWEKCPPNPDRRKDHSFFTRAIAAIKRLILPDWMLNAQDRGAGRAGRRAKESSR